MSHQSKTISQLTPLDGADLGTGDKLLVYNNDGTTRALDYPVFQDKVGENFRADTQGYYALLTNFYFVGGQPTETSIELADTDAWQDVNFTTDALGLFDNRPQGMKDAIADPYNDTTQQFSLEGLSTTANIGFRASMSFEPDEDEGQVQARLLFTRHSGTTPDTQFPIEDIALTMTQGAGVDYPAEPYLSFFVGDTIDTNGVGDAGTCKFQIKSTVPGTVRMRALTWFINA